MVRLRRGAEATINDVRDAADELFDRASPAFRAALTEAVLGGWKTFGPDMWLTPQESDATALRLLTTLHLERGQLEEGLAAGLPVANLLSLYSDEGTPMLVTLRQGLKEASRGQLDQIYSALPLEMALGNATTHIRALAAEQIATKSWVRIHLPDFDLLGGKQEVLSKTIAEVLLWHRYRTSARWPLGLQVNHVRLTVAFLDAWDGALRSN